MPGRSCESSGRALAVFQIMTLLTMNLLQYPRLIITLRVLLAIVGGYFTSNAIGIAFSRQYPGSLAEGSMAAVIASFAIYSVIIIWCFATRALLRTTILLAAISGLSVLLSMLVGRQG